MGVPNRNEVLMTSYASRFLGEDRIIDVWDKSIYLLILSLGRRRWPAICGCVEYKRRGECARGGQFPRKYNSWKLHGRWTFLAGDPLFPHHGT